jgi:hypothetical protein
VHPQRSINDRVKLSNEAREAIEAVLEAGEGVRVVIRSTFGSGLVATDRRMLIWKKGRLVEFAWTNVSDVVIGGGALVRWIQVRGPSIGLVQPTLLNIGDLVDTVQLTEPLDEGNRGQIEMLVSRHAQGQPLEHETRTTTGPTLMEAAGAGGRLELMADRIRIHHLGFRGFFRKALPAQKEIPFEEIVSVEWRPPGAFRLGRMGFRLKTPAGDASNTVAPEDEVMFYLYQEVTFRELRADLERRLGPLRRGAEPQKR